MKMRIILLATILLTSSCVLGKEKLESSSKSETSNKIKAETTTFNSNESKLDIIGEAYNTDNKPVVAVAYGVASNAAYSLKDDTGFIKPEIVVKLAEQVLPPAPGPKEAVNEIPSLGEYYDGSLKLNKIDVKCKIYANPTDCIHQSSCGWCGSNNSCITGNNIGPMEPCVKGSYIFSPPLPNWQPQTKIVNENVGGVKMTVISK